MLNTLLNPMNPSFQKYNEYMKYRNIIKSKLKYLEFLDGININDSMSLSSYKPKSSDVQLNTNVNNKGYNTKLYPIDEEGQNNIMGNNKNSLQSKYNIENEDIEENGINALATMKKRHSSITFSQRMLRKADNLTKFNRKNHSEGNKHITNDYL